MKQQTSDNDSHTVPMMKRVFDLVGAVAALGVFAPVLGASAVAIRATMGAPVLFTQERPGLREKPFRLLKFRTMRPVNPGEDMASSDGLRITALGRFLRSSSLDELPTLWNVVRGDMSLVGPRPLLMSYLARYTREQSRRHNVKPGITGWAQVNGRNALSWEEKFQLDLWYVDHQSLLLDARILAMTAWKVFRREGISQKGHATMPEFLGDSSAPKAAGG